MAKIWEHNDCIVLFWNQDKLVTGIKIEKKAGKLSVLDSAVSSPDAEQLAIAISEVANSLATSETHLMLAGCDIPGSVSFDINLPKMSVVDMKQAILYELPRHIPCDPNDVIFGYRVISSSVDVSAASKQTVRILAVMKKNWNELLSELTGSGIKVDAVITPYLAVDPIFENEEIVVFTETDKYISFARSSEYPGRRIEIKEKEGEEEEIHVDDMKEIIKKLDYEWGHLPPDIKKDPSVYFPALLMAAYGVSSEYAFDKHSLIKLPPELIPERYRTLRSAFFGLIGTIVLLVLMLVGRYWWESRDRFAKLNGEIKSVENKINQVVAKQRRFNKNAEIIKEIIDTQKGNAEIATCLHKISMVLPKEMWLAHFSSRDHSIDISIRYIKSGTSVPDFSKTGIMQVVTSSSRTNPRDGTTTEYIRLRYIPPEKRNENK